MVIVVIRTALRATADLAAYEAAGARAVLRSYSVQVCEVVRAYDFTAPST